MPSSCVADKVAKYMPSLYAPSLDLFITSSDYAYNKAKKYIHKSMTAVPNVNKWPTILAYLSPSQVYSKVGIESRAEEMHTNSTIFSNIMYEDRLYCLNAPISFYIEKSDQYFLIDYEPLSIFVCEQSREDAIQDFFERFDMLWCNYVEDKETPLSKDALNLRDKLVTIVKEVKNV